MNIVKKATERIEKIVKSKTNLMILPKNSEELEREIRQTSCLNVDEAYEFIRTVQDQEHEIKELQKLCTELGNSESMDPALVKRLIKTTRKDDKSE